MKRYIVIVCILCTWLGSTQGAKSPSLRDKIGQMLILGFDGSRVDKQSSIVNAIIQDNLGGVILYDFNHNTHTFDRNIASPKQVKQLNSTLQLFATQGNQIHHRPMLSLIISVDYEGGYANRLAERYGFPSTFSAERIGGFSHGKAKKQIDKMAGTLKKNGFNLNYAPSMDVNVNPNNPIIGKKGRSFSADPNRVSVYGKMVSSSLNAHKIVSVCKHFPGHGSSKKDSHLGFVDVSKTWQPYELLPFKDAIKKQGACPVMMTAHIVNKRLDSTGAPATLSKRMLTTLLRKQLGFKGVIMTDDMQMKAITGRYGIEDAVVRAINAGADMMIFANHTKRDSVQASQIIDMIESNVKKGKISAKRIDEAYQRIRFLKQNLKDHGASIPIQ